MNEVEYVLRVILKARDELAGSLKKAREELKLFASAADSNSSKINAFNKSIEQMDKNVTNITNKFAEWRAVIQGTAGENEDARKSFGQLGKEVDATTRKTTTALKTQRDLVQAARAANREQKELTKSYQAGNASLDYTVANLGRVSKELDRYSAKMNTGTQASKEVFKWARNSREAADSIIADERRKAKATEEAEERRIRAVQRTNDLISAEILDQIKREEEAEKLRLRNVKRSNDAIGREITQQIKDEEDAQKKRLKNLEELEKDRVKAVKRGNDAIAREIEQQITREEKAARDHQRMLDDFERKRVNSIKRANDAIGREIEQQIRDEEAASKKRIDQKQQELDAITALAKAAKAREGLSDRKGRTIDPSLASDAKAAARELSSLSRAIKHDTDLSRDLRIESEALSTQFKQTQRDANRTGGALSGLRNWFDSNSDSVAGLDNTLRGIGWLAVAGFANQLVTILGGLAGTFVAVAASAAQAGAAIGGAFVAGIGQALPSIGLLAGALVRVKSVMDAVKQSQTAQQAAAVQGAGASRRVADATDTLRTANESLTTAQDRLKESQAGLTDARKDARRDLEDLIQAERDAELAAAGAALSQKEAQQALISAQATGDTAGIQRAQLRVLEATNDAEQSLTDKRRARADAAKAQRGGVEGMEGVQNAKKAIEDAQRAVEKAGRGIQTAKRNAGEAAQGTQTAAATLNYLLSQLSPAEVRLYRALKNIQEAYKRTYRPITDILVNSFTRGVDRVTQIIQMPKVVDLARKTATTLSRQLNRVFDGLTSDKMIDQFIRIGEAGRKNLKPLADIALSVGHSLANIAEAAGPSFAKMLRFVRGLVQSFEELTGNRRKMTEFFNEGEKHFEAWIRLGLSVIQLFMALAGAGGAESGLTSIKDATKAIDDLTKKVNSNKGDVAGFFEDARKIAYEVVSVIAVLAEELATVFTPERVESFTDLIKTVLIPGLVDAIGLFGQITAFLIKIADTPLGKQILQFGVALFFVTKIATSTFGAIGQFAKALNFMFGGLFKILEKLLPGLRLVGPQMARAALGAIAPWALIIGAVVLLLDKLGLLDDLWRELKSGFNAFWKEVKPSVDKLVVSFQEAWDAVRQGKGAFAVIRPLVSVLRTILRAVIQIGGVFARVFGRTLGRVVGGLIDVLTGLINFLTGVFTGDWRKAWNGIKQIFGGIFRAIGGLMRAIPELVHDIAKKIAPLFKRGIEALWDYLKGLPRRLGNIASQGADAFVKAFKNVGGDIIKGIASGLKATGGFAKDLANSFIDLLNSLLPDRIKVPGAPDIDLPNNPIPHLRKGGIVPGTGKGDIVSAMLEPGEHVLTSAEVTNAGGHAAIFAFRRSLGGGGQGGSGRYQRGGRVSGAGGLTIDFEGGDLDDFQSQWRKFWNALAATARRGAQSIEKTFRDMRVDTTRTADRMYRDVRSSLADLERSFDARGKRMVNKWAETWQSLKKVTHEGLFYIGHETNKALTTLGEKALHFHLAPPKKADTGKADGGWIGGGKGQRGRDMGYYALGDGEAVLNWQHQSYVEPAMNAYYGHGLGTMFDRVHGYHAGGGGTGFAGGRAPQFGPIPGMPGEEANTRVIPLIMKLIKQYHAIITDAYDRDHSAGHKSPGHNVTGTAIDAVPAAGNWNAIEAMGKWAVAQGMIVGYGPGVPGSQPWPGHGRGQHIHIELGSNPSAAAAFMTEIARPIVEGGGQLAKLSQAAIDHVLKAANAKLSETFAATQGGATDFKVGKIAAGAEPIFKFFRQHGFTDEQAAGWVGNFIQESGLNPSVVQPGGEGHGLAQWGGGRFAALQAFAKQHGKPWQDRGAQLAFVLSELSGPESAANRAIKSSKTVEEATNAIGSQYERYGIQGDRSGPAREVFSKFADKYDKGGIIPGPEGTPVPILAHAQEWILNNPQVNRLASMLGTSRSSLRSMMGFYGGPGGAQGGTEIEEITPLTTKEVKGIDPRSLRKVVVALRAIGRNIDRAAAGLGSAEVWSGYVDKTAAALNRLTRRIKGKAEKGDNEKAFRGFLDSMDQLLGENGPFAKLRTALERGTARAATRLARRGFAVSRTGVVRDRLTDVQEARRTLGQARNEREGLVDERSDIARSLRQVRRQQRRPGLSQKAKERLQAQENQLRGMLDEAETRIVDNLQSITDAQVALQEAKVARETAAVDKINARAEQRLTRNDFARRIAEVLGDELGIDKVNRKQREILADQAKGLEGRLDNARKAGATDLVRDIENQIRDINTTIVESIQAELREAAERINTRAQRGLGRIDLAGRMLDALGAVGLGGVATAGGVLPGRAELLQQRTGTLQTQRAELTGLRDRAGGNIGLIQDLNDQIEELTVQIAENTKAQFDAKLEESSTRTSFGLNVTDLEKRIIELDGSMSGQLDQSKILANLQKRGNILATQRMELEAFLAEARVAGNTQAINDLTVQILENVIATKENTIATDEASGVMKDPQTFTSSAWTWFREAVFTGMGQVMPQYDMSLGGGADAMSGGINTGAVVIPSVTTSSTRAGDTNITLNEAGRDPDLTEISSIVTFASKTDQ